MKAKHSWNNYIYRGQWTEISVKLEVCLRAEGRHFEHLLRWWVFQTMYLLSKMHIRVYNARHIKREAALIFLGRWCGRFACTSRRQKSHLSESFKELLVVVVLVVTAEVSGIHFLTNLHDANWHVFQKNLWR
jgi:hypothetical protein